MKKIMTLTISSLLFLNLSNSIAAPISPKNSLECSKNDQAVIHQALTNLADDSSSEGPAKIKTYYTRCAHQYALAKILSLQPFSTPTFVFLHKEQANWKVINLSEDFDPDFLNTVPSELRHFYS